MCCTAPKRITALKVKQAANVYGAFVSVSIWEQQRINSSSIIPAIWQNLEHNTLESLVCSLLNLRAGMCSIRKTVLPNSTHVASAFLMLSNKSAKGGGKRDVEGCQAHFI